MDDGSIVEPYFVRSEQAIKETDTKYGGYCFSIAYNILANSATPFAAVNIVTAILAFSISRLRLPW